MVSVDEHLHCAVDEDPVAEPPFETAARLATPSERGLLVMGEAGGEAASRLKREDTPLSHYLCASRGLTVSGPNVPCTKREWGAA